MRFLEFREVPVTRRGLHFLKCRPNIMGGYEENRGNHQTLQDGGSEGSLNRNGNPRSDRE